MSPRVPTAWLADREGFRGPSRRGLLCRGSAPLSPKQSVSVLARAVPFSQGQGVYRTEATSLHLWHSPMQVTQKPRLRPRWAPARIQTLLGSRPWTHHWRANVSLPCAHPRDCKDGQEVVVFARGDVDKAWAGRLRPLYHQIRGQHSKKGRILKSILTF